MITPGKRDRSALFVTWERHRRTRELAHTFGARLVEISAPRVRQPLLRYPWLLARTAWHIARRRPDVLLVQCPSILLGAWCVVLRPIFRYTLIADLHNEAVVPFNYSFGLYRSLLLFIRRGADISLVSNEALERIVVRSGGRAFVLPDKVPDLQPGATVTAQGDSPCVVLICTFAPDEPVREVIDAARLLPGVRLLVTGNARGFRDTTSLPANVTLTGFLDDAAYVALLKQADVLIDLTRMDNCLVCGAYEAVALQKPLVTSDTHVLRAHFSRGTVFTQHDPESLAAAIGQALADRDRLAHEMRVLKRELRDRWSAQGRELGRIVQLEVR